MTRRARPGRRRRPSPGTYRGLWACLRREAVFTMLTQFRSMPPPAALRKLVGRMPVPELLRTWHQLERDLKRRFWYDR